MVVSVGIDVSKNKHDCFIVSSEGEVLADVFTIPNNMDGFYALLEKIRACTTPQDKIKVGLEATGHYSYNILGFLLDNGLVRELIVQGNIGEGSHLCFPPSCWAYISSIALFSFR